MDFKRIEWILLVVFVGISIFLGFEIVQTPIHLSTSSQAQSSDVYGEMVSDNIVWPKKLSDAPEDAYYLAASPSTALANAKVAGSKSFDRNSLALTVTLSNPVPLAHGREKALEQILAFKNSETNVAHGRDYVLDRLSSTNKTYQFDQMTSFGRLYYRGARLQINVASNAIIGYRQTYLPKVEAVREKQATISQRHALKSLYTLRELPNNSRVTKVEMGYRHLTTVRNNVIFLPVWRLGIENRATGSMAAKQVNAFTGALLQNSN
jgi:regulatory protein YycI of two-component signal transduction system YycFG